MPWENKGSGGGGPWGGGQSSGGDDGGGPWNRGGGGGGGPRPPDLEDFIRKGQDRFKGFFPGGGMPGGRGFLVILAIIGLIWLASGTYRVQPDEQGVVLRFGKWVDTTQPGLNWHFPYPIETVETPAAPNTQGGLPRRGSRCRPAAPRWRRGRPDCRRCASKSRYRLYRARLST